MHFHAEMMGSGPDDLTTIHRSSRFGFMNELRVGALIAQVSVSVNRMVVYMSTNYLDEADNLSLRF